MLAAPPISGVLYERFGFRAPFIFGIIVTAFDLVFRLLVIERVDALKWGHDPALSKKSNTEVDVENGKGHIIIYRSKVLNSILVSEKKQDETADKEKKKENYRGKKKKTQLTPSSKFPIAKKVANRCR